MEAKRAPKSPPIDIKLAAECRVLSSDYEAGTVEAFILNTTWMAVDEILGKLLEDLPPHIYFRRLGDDGLDHASQSAPALELAIWLPFGHPDTPPTWVFSLNELIDAEIMDRTNDFGEVDADEYQPLLSVATALRSLAAKIEAKIGPNEPAEKAGVP